MTVSIDIFRSEKVFPFTDATSQPFSTALAIQYRYTCPSLLSVIPVSSSVLGRCRLDGWKNEADGTELCFKVSGSPETEADNTPTTTASGLHGEVQCGSKGLVKY